MFRKIPTSRFPTPYDLNIAQVTSCLMPKNHITSQNAVYNSPLKENRIFYDDDEDENDNNRNRNLKTSKALLWSQAHQGTRLFTSAATNQRGVFQEGNQEKLRSDFQNTRREQSTVAVKVGVIQMERVNDQKQQL